MSVPGFRVHDALATVTGNTIIDIILRGQGTQLQQTLALHPTFATVWFNNDALAAATSGRVIEGVTLTSTASFEARTCGRSSISSRLPAPSWRWRRSRT